MVRSKDVPKKKPKDPLLTPPSKLRGAGFLDEGLPRNRGGAAMSPAPASVPNYMRGTSSSDAKGGRRRARLTATATAAASASPSARRRPSVRVVARGKVLFPEAPSSPASGSRALGRATCSSTLKEAKFPAALDLAPGATDAEGPAAMRVCPYTYCSLNGHAHAPAVPLRSFLASRRRLIKTQQSMKLKGASPFRKPNNGGGEGYFVEVRAGAGAAGSDVSCSELSAEEMDAMVRRMEYVTFDRQGCGDDAEDKAKGSGASVDGSCGSSDVISGGSIELLGTTKNRGGKEKTILVEDHEDQDFGACKSDISEELGTEHEGYIPEGSSNAPKESSTDSVSSALSGISFEDVSSRCADAASSQKKLVVARRRRTSEEGGEQIRPFKPRAPNFLPVETGPGAEKVDLRHQTTNDRRDAEEWMVDYALRKAVKKLARAQKRKVEMLVQAFETVLPTVTDEKKPVEHDDDKTSFTLSRPSQACR